VLSKHVLPVIRQPHFDDDLKESASHAPLGLPAKTNVNAILLSVALIHAAPWAANLEEEQGLRSQCQCVGSEQRYIVKIRLATATLE
jgi:hypothetical protein